MTVRIPSAEAMVSFGEALGRVLAPGDVVALTGDLGAGKTTMIRGIVRGAGSQARVRSPSYVRLTEYAGPVTIYHFDLYRVEAADPEWSATLAEVAGDDGIALIEWGERIVEYLPAERIEVAIGFEGEARRVSISATAPGAQMRIEGALAAWLAVGGVSA